MKMKMAYKRKLSITWSSIGRPIVVAIVETTICPLPGTPGDIQAFLPLTFLSDLRKFWVIEEYKQHAFYPCVSMVSVTNFLT